MQTAVIKSIFIMMMIATSLFAEVENEEAVTHGLFFQDYPTSSHPGAYHLLQGIIFPGGGVVIEDGSEWVVAPYYWEALKGWTAGDVLLLTPYRPWFFHYYEFQLINERTQETVLVNWYKPPQQGNPFTRSVARLHSYEIVLDDGTRWRVKASDRQITQTWKQKDTIIIGTNYCWFAWSNPNILINMRNSTYIRGGCMH